MIMTVPHHTSELHLARCAHYLENFASTLGPAGIGGGLPIAEEAMVGQQILFTVEALSAWYVR